MKHDKSSLIEQALGRTQPTKPMQPAQEGDETFNGVVDEIAALIMEGKVPEDFNLEEAFADEAFVELLLDFPLEAAIRIYRAERQAADAETSAKARVAEQVRSRSALPRSTRGGGYVSPRTDYKNMDSAEFSKLLQQVKKTARSGGTTRL